MRIIGGKNKSRNIQVSKKFSARPTTDMAKEGLFNIIDNNFYFDKLRVLDLFAGTGSISYEFASRGCNDITSVDISQKNISFINKNTQILDADKSIKAFKADVFKFVKQQRSVYDIIFADPPYDFPTINTIPELIFDSKMLKSEGWLIIEHSSITNFSSHKYFKRLRQYGKVNFSFFEIENK